MVVIDQEGKTGHRWWLGVVLGVETTVFRLDPSRSHERAENHFPAASDSVPRVDRSGASKARAEVKPGQGILVVG